MHELVQPVVRCDPVVGDSDAHAGHGKVHRWVATRAFIEEPRVRHHDGAIRLGVLLERGHECGQFAVRCVGADDELPRVLPRGQPDALVPSERGGVAHDRHR